MTESPDNPAGEAGESAVLPAARELMKDIVSAAQVIEISERRIKREERERKRQERLRQAREYADQIDDKDWLARIKLSNDGGMAQWLNNIVLILTHDEEWSQVLWFNEMAAEVVIRQDPPWSALQHDAANPETPKEGRPWTRADDARLISWLEAHTKYHASFATARIREAISLVGRRRSYHPVQDYLDSLKWDGRPRIDTWLINMYGAADTPFTRRAGRYWLMSAVARAYEPGCKADYVLVLEGDQGIRKSTSLEALFGTPFFDRTRVNLDTGKEAFMQLAGKWGIEMQEMQSVVRADPEAVKEFITNQIDRYVLKYENSAIDKPRTYVLAGTSNNAVYLRDVTGGRRFWPIKCTYALVEKIQELRDQIWAEATWHFLGYERCVEEGAEFRAQFPDILPSEPFCEPGVRCVRHRWWPSPEEEELHFVDNQQARFEGDPWEQKLHTWLNPNEGEARMPPMNFTAERALTEGIGMEPSRQEMKHLSRIGRCLARLGYERIDRKPVEPRYIYRKKEVKKESRKEGKR